MFRVLLHKDIQFLLCISAKKQLELNWRQLANYLEVTPRAFENWYRGLYLLPEEIFIKLNNISGLNISDYKLVGDSWGQTKGGRRNVELHGNFFGTIEGRRKAGNKLQLLKQTKNFTLQCYSENLAEFIGIMLGDGGMDRVQISVTLGYTTDKNYVPYVRNLIYKLFKAESSLYRSKVKDAIRIRASGVNLVKNLLTLGLVVGNKTKQQIDIPLWIQEKEGYIKACIRGMVDTDGCVHRKVRREPNGIEYRSIGITFSSASKPLQISLRKLFSVLGFKTSISGKTVYLCGKEQIKKYIEEIGFSNPKHFSRYQEFLLNYGWKKFIPENCLIPQATV